MYSTTNYTDWTNYVKWNEFSVRAKKDRLVENSKPLKTLKVAAGGEACKKCIAQSSTRPKKQSSHILQEKNDLQRSTADFSFTFLQEAFNLLCLSGALRGKKPRRYTVQYIQRLFPPPPFCQFCFGVSMRRHTPLHTRRGSKRTQVVSTPFPKPPPPPPPLVGGGKGLLNNARRRRRRRRQQKSAHISTLNPTSVVSIVAGFLVIPQDAVAVIPEKRNFARRTQFPEDKAKKPKTKK